MKRWFAVCGWTAWTVGAVFIIWFVRRQWFIGQADLPPDIALPLLLTNLLRLLAGLLLILIGQLSLVGHQLTKRP